MTRYYHPDEFAELKRIALGLGFVHVEAGPLVRSSYHAHEQADAATHASPADGRRLAASRAVESARIPCDARACADVSPPLLLLTAAAACGDDAPAPRRPPR